MGQYQTGTVTVFQGSNKVSGESCAWITNGISAGHTFKKSGDDAIYTIALVNSETTLSLSSNYAGTSGSGESYQICRDFTSNYDIPEVWAGDKDWAFHLTQALRLIDTQLASVSASAGLVDEIVDQGEVTTLNLTSSDLNKVHLLKNSGEALINLPSGLGPSNAGSWLDFRKRGSGEVNIYRTGSDLINGQTIVRNLTEQTFARIVLSFEEAGVWGSGDVLGDWEFTT